MLRVLPSSFSSFPRCVNFPTLCYNEFVADANLPHTIYSTLKLSKTHQRLLNTPTIQQTAELEHETFRLRQQAAVSADIKSVLDSWVRHEAQVREQEQKDLVESVLASVQKQIGDKKLQKDILLSAVAEVEGKFYRF